jgi:ribonuclease P protein component
MIQLLFRTGRSFFVRPFKVVYLYDPDGAEKTVQVLVTVSKKNFKKAVKRNEIKRKVREAYRLNKFLLDDVLKQPHGNLVLGLVYTGNTAPDTEEVREKIIRALERLKMEILSEQKR